MRTKIATVIFGVLALLVVGLSVPALRAPEARAQSSDVGNFARPWIGQGEYLVTFSNNAQTIALLCTANFTNGTALASGVTCNHNIRTLQISCTASGEVSFYKGSTVSGPNYLGGIGVIANTPCPVPESILRSGIKGGLGNPIYVVSPNGTLSLIAWVRDDKS